MLFFVRAYGRFDSSAFRSAARDRRGSFLEFPSLDVVPEDVQAATDFYEISAAVTANGYRLGTHASLLHPEVMVMATGDEVVFTATNLETARRVWNNHAEGVAAWLSEFGRPGINFGVPFEIRVYGADPQFFTREDGSRRYASYGSFGDAWNLDLALAHSFEVRSVTPENTYRLGTYQADNGREFGQAWVVSTGTSLVVTGDEIHAVQDAWEAHMAGIGRHLEQSRTLARTSSRGLQVLVFCDEQSHPLLPFVREDGTYFGVFEGVVGVPSVLFSEKPEGLNLYYSVKSVIPDTYYKVGIYNVLESAEDDAHTASIEATGRSIRVMSSNLDFALEVWNYYMAAMGGDEDDPFCSAAREVFALMQYNAFKREEAGQNG